MVYNDKIYQILNNVNSEVYVGSTTQPLCKRMHEHRRHMKTKPHYKLYKHMHELGVDNFYIELVENCPCNDVYELREREGYYIRERATLNKKIEGRTQIEWYDDNSEYVLAEKKKYRDTHKDAMQQYRKDNKEHIQQVVKQYFENNQEDIRQYRKNIYNKLRFYVNVATRSSIEAIYQLIQKTLKCRSSRNTASNTSTSAGSDE